MYKNKILWALLMALSGALLILASVVVGSPATAVDLQEAEAKLYQKYGVKVVNIGEPSLLPRKIQSAITYGQDSIDFAEASSNQLAQVLAVLDAALGKYPSSVLKEAVKEIRIGDHLVKNDEVIYGYYETRHLFIFADSAGTGIDAREIEKTLHHELSSLLAERYGFPYFDWLALNSPDFEYLVSDQRFRQAIAAGLTYAPQQRDLVQGIVSGYGRLNAENDFNTYAETVFTQPRQMADWLAKYPQVQKKYRFLKAFYLKVSPGFEGVFDKVEHP
ncbi:hypothetical protein [Gallaecimonas xiamenensis]|uniref:Uncharacterized protein n=1 Tax=Gallaecimonas xiamenensis 3-C-1 TaxID=745411 RepID=K2JR50_9GAMM|nr:hypothetical protein [Gallaecimonas xiamenensis]EKE77002.1 hypothetical protein B3C1_02315 [Gallaecimonas xiamenensis 3-C-1]